MSMLDKIVAQRLLDVEEAQSHTPAHVLQEKITRLAPAADFVAALRQASPCCVLAEFKRASPSKGDIAVGLDAAQQALSYAVAGACTVSVLTEPSWFKGSLSDLTRVKETLVEANLSPGVCVLRKDFLVDEYQLLEARAAGADTALLIVAILQPDRLTAMMHAARQLGMEPLVEVNTREEMEVALAAGAKVIGVNNRNLHTFVVDMGTTGTIAAMLPEGTDIQLLALSGVATRADVEQLLAVKANGVLVGESLMRAESPAAAIRSLVGAPPAPSLCKICGLRDAEAAAVAVDAGADFLGMIFAPSKRQVTEEEAKRIVRVARERRPRPAGWKLPNRTIALAQREGEEADCSRWLQTWQGLLMRAAATGGPLTVGVFVNATVEEMNGTAERVGLDLIQLHGSEGWEIAKQLNRPCVRVVHMLPDSLAEQVSSELRGGLAVAVLLDSKGGGTGTTFNWSVGREVQAAAPFILAGGLSPANVASAIEEVKPWCVDVSSGVETDGTKDHAKIAAFIKNVKAASTA
ncbi:hypothetical protein AB1Y20_009226 [Prymnesium parvum]